MEGLLLDCDYFDMLLVATKKMLKRVTDDDVMFCVCVCDDVSSLSFSKTANKNK